MRLAVLTTHPIQYYGPLFRELARRVDLKVLFAHWASPDEQGRAGFGHAFDWDIDITGGYAHSFLANTARRPGTDTFRGCDTPDIGERLRAGGYDALLLTGWGSKTYLQGLLAAKRLGLPVLVRGDSHLGTPRSTARTALKACLYPAFLRMFDAAAYVGARSRAYYAHYRYPAERLFFSPHCVDTGRFAAGATPEAREGLRRRLGIGAATPVALLAGKLIVRKRPFDLVTAAASCRRRGVPVEILVAGSGPLEEEIAAAAARAEVPMHRLGFCNQSRLPEVYAASDCLVLASDIETWGLVANEALACNRPIVVSDACGCVPDLTQDPLAGRSFRTGDPDALSDALTRVITMTRTEAPRALAQRYGLSAATDGIEAALQSVRRRRP
ncbi:Glycosyltransferase involved in cell wall bisynthesis [Methylobacterium sp. 174MFSha1.1]|uniref:glycosyltransferase family 4 protein n=1 Tax=Methylobacterium sp. 174MFSha1.1 TaxID=1502749 RepID=UPI0008EDFD70|nr:glycosyltransferase family 4 protein [Methylobacterium sp. 174MFSha1.1]SFU46913.1 Glycosyltransferase involved in cell wall bisynthesis [Methylobacterium sp. 174MFSha1.1]